MQALQGKEVYSKERQRRLRQCVLDYMGGKKNATTKKDHSEKV
jgi:hypothetical protein